MKEQENRRQPFKNYYLNIKLTAELNPSKFLNTKLTKIS